MHYQPLPGLTLRQLISAEQTDVLLRQHLGSLIARLHDCGVYFRSLHLGNVVQPPEGELGLIDIADMRTQPRALSRLQCKRNFAHMLRYTQDRAWLLADGGAQLCQGYRLTSAMSWPPGLLEQTLQQP